LSAAGARREPDRRGEHPPARHPLRPLPVAAVVPAHARRLPAAGARPRRRPGHRDVPRPPRAVAVRRHPPQAGDRPCPAAPAAGAVPRRAVRRARPAEQAQPVVAPARDPGAARQPHAGGGVPDDAGGSELTTSASAGHRGLAVELWALLAIAQRDLVKLLRDRPRLAVNLAFPVLLVAGLGSVLQPTVGKVTGVSAVTLAFTGVLPATLFQSTAAGMISIAED